MANIVGTPLDDSSLVGTPAADDISGLAGDDFLNAGAGNDVLRGGPGLDNQDAGPGNDIYVYDSVEDSPVLQQPVNLLQNGSFEFGTNPGVYLPRDPCRSERHWESIDFPSFSEKIIATGIGSKSANLSAAFLVLDYVKR